MNRYVIPVIVALNAISVIADAQVRIARSREELVVPFSVSDKSVFLHPERVNYPETWFHYIDGNVDKDGITKDLEAIAETGISGIQLFHGGQFGGDWPGVRQHIECLSPYWNDAVAHTAAEAARLGLRFTMQNCPGWAMSGGPWIESKNAMRDLVWSRVDLSGNAAVETVLPMPVRPNEVDWRDYTDVAVLAFPTPADDINGPSVPDRISSDIGQACWPALFSGQEGQVTLAPVEDGGCHTITLEYDKPVTLRSIVFSPVRAFYHDFCYEPGIMVTVTAVFDDGRRLTVLDESMPMSNWEDDKEMTFALDESTASKYVVTIANEHDMTITALKMLSAARKNNWEADAAWTLRSRPYGSERPVQSQEAFVSAGSIIDISSYMSSDGRLEWDVPDGKWTVLRIGHVNCGYMNSPAPKEATGWECDKLSERGADAHFAGYVKKLADGPAKGVLNAMLMDSWECKSQTWTVKMEDEFRSFNGYELRTWMPALFGYVIDNHETTAAFLNDWRACINHLFTDKFYGRMAQNAKASGLNIAYETAAGDIFPADILEYYKYADVPMCEFWNHSTPTFVGSINFKPIRMTASAARLYGKTRVSAESFTSFQLTWDEHLSRLKDLANQNFAQGVTHAVFHTYTHNPCADSMIPGTSFGSDIGTPFLRGQTWWKHMPEFNAYLARLSYMLERGRPVSDVLWYLGDGYMHKPDQNVKFPDGYKYDYCNQDILLNRLSVSDGRIVTPEGISYSVLWIPDSHNMLPATVAKLKELVMAGAVVVADAPDAVGTLVTSVDAAAAHGAGLDSYASDIDALWGGSDGTSAVVRRLGTGKVLAGYSIGQALAELGIRPDLLDAGTGEETSAKWMHRSAEGADWYFIAAPLGQPFSGTLDFSCIGSVSIWDPVSGETTTPEDVRYQNGRTSVAVNLPYAGSCFVVFTQDEKKIRNASSKYLVTNLDNWSLSFPEGWGAPTDIEIDSLVSWTCLPISDEGRAFSGTATYTCSLRQKRMSEHSRFVLELGAVEEIAKVIVNGVELRTLWCEPYCVDVTSVLHKGMNEIRVEVTNTWFNRLAFDAALPEAERKTWVIRGPEAGSELRPSGLLGPVSLIEYK